MKAIGVIPARYGSKRFRGKPIEKIGGVPMIVVIARETMKSKYLSEVIVATDSELISYELEKENIPFVMTGEFETGTDRVWSVVKERQCDIIVNIQGDEPMIKCEMIDAIVLSCFSCQMTFNLLSNIDQDEIEDKNIVKAIIEGGIIKDLSRAPFENNNLKQSGLYSFLKKDLELFFSLEQTKNEAERSIEMIRLIDNGVKVGAIITDKKMISVDTVEDLISVGEYYEKQNPLYF